MIQSTTARQVARLFVTKGMSSTWKSQIMPIRSLASMAVATSEGHQIEPASERGFLRTPSISTDPDWMKTTIQQILKHYDNNIKGTQQKLSSDSDPFLNNKKAIVSDEDLEKSLQYFLVRIFMYSSYDSGLKNFYCHNSFKH
jgi:hypothetical protein